jgi:hypothetical protein
MKDIVKNSLKKSMTYQAYRQLVVDLLKKGKSTGEKQSDDLLNYSKLNNSRMKRLDKTFKLSEQAKEIINNSDKKYHWIVLTESWCGDAAHSLPVINKIVEASGNIELNIVLRDENEALMDAFLTDGSRSIPKLIALDANTNEVVSTWGPRPSEATQMVKNYKEKFGSLDAEFKKDLQVWYNANKGENIEKDIVDMLCVAADCI